MSNCTTATCFERRYKILKFLRTRTKTQLAIFALALVIGIARIFNNVQYNWYIREVAPYCHTPPDVAKELDHLANACLVALRDLGLQYFLVYGSLFGAIRHQAPLAWDNDIDIAVVFPPNIPMDGRSLPALQEHLEPLGVSVEYSAWGGFFRVTYGSSRGDLMVYKRRGKWMVRDGWEGVVFRWNYNRYHRFPARLVEESKTNPLPTLPFGKLKMPVPREGLEIMKYHYPHDWWMEAKPKNCIEEDKRRTNEGGAEGGAESNHVRHRRVAEADG